MDITQRVSEALRVYRTVAVLQEHATSVCNWREPAPVVNLPAPNVLYVGHAEYHEMVRDRLHSMPGVNGEVTFMDLTVVRVHLDSWLQVNYVGGAK